jgi:hypothetical protein
MRNLLIDTTDRMNVHNLTTVSNYVQTIEIGPKSQINPADLKILRNLQRLLIVREDLSDEDLLPQLSLLWCIRAQITDRGMLQMTNLTDLTISNNNNIESLVTLTNLRTLSIANVAGIRDLHLMTSLETLYINEPNFSGLLPSNLLFLSVVNTNINTQLVGLTNLVDLYAKYTLLTNDTLSRLTTLTRLTIKYIPFIYSISTLTNLRELIITDSHISNKDISMLTQLQSIIARETDIDNSIIDILPLMKIMNYKFCE